MRQLQGSCHCGAVRFTVQSHAPQPYMRCYCSICRKTAGGGGYAINLSGQTETLEVIGKADVRIYRARGVGGDPDAVSEGQRHFCGLCGSALWVYDPRWPELVHPFASAIDSPLPRPPERVHIMLDSKADWVEVPPESATDRRFAGYPEESIAEWHRARGLYED